MNDVESQSMDQTPDADGNDNWLVGCDRTQGASIEMIEMRVRDENEIDGWQMVNVKTRFLEPFDYTEPHRPDGIDEDVGVVRLNQK